MHFESIKSKDTKIDLIKDFEHNYIIVENGELISSNFNFEDKNKIKIKKFLNESYSDKKETNSLINLNHALSENGYFLQVDENYKFKKILVIYHLFTDDLNENFLNSKNKIIIGKFSEVHTLDLVINNSKKNFFNSVNENITLDKSSVFKNISIQNDKGFGYFYKFSQNKLHSNANYSSFIFPSGLKFNKLDLTIDLEGENSQCNVQSASYLDHNDHQEIKTKINHFFPNCKSHQKVKNVLNSNSKGVFQGKIFVKNIAQKTDAYQLSKAILLSETSEFDSKPELEIYADDVKCSHGSSSGSIDNDSIYYLMSRGLNKKESTKLLINGFLNEVVDSIKSNSIRKFIHKKIENQLHEYKKH